MATVMVVDDVAANREIVRMLLGFRGHEVIEAHDGADALRLAHTHHPDVVVSDVLMPGIDGLELVHRLRADPDREAAQAPVIFYTANYLEPETRPIAEACGVSQVVLRSQDPDALLDAIDTALASGPIDVGITPDDDFAQAHLHAVNAKLIEKVRALHDTERRFEAMAVASPVGIGIIDRHGVADYVNERLAEITRLPMDQLVGHGWLACLERSAQEPALALLHGAGDDTELRFTHRVTRSDGSVRSLRVHLRQTHDEDDGLTGGVLMVDDVTDVTLAEERLREETELRQDEARRSDAERMDSLRRMAGGTAHDFNNILGAILGYTNLAMESITDGRDDGTIPAEVAEALLGDLAQVIKGGQRAQTLTQQLLAFGRREVNQPAEVDMNALLRDCAGSLASAVGRGSELVLDLAPGLPKVKADPSQLARALHNLVRNSGEAMPEGGTVTIRTSVEDGRVVVGVHDVGAGMPQDVLDRAFDPFFSTKSTTGTVGLGLSTAHGIVSQAGGQLTLTSREGQGTTANFTLPAIADSAPPAPAPPKAPERHSAGGETLLLVDDEEAVLQVTARILSGAGYRVLTAPDAAEALRLLERHGGEVAALVTDVVMPGMDGRQLARIASGRRPDLCVVFVSGFAESLFDEHGNNLEPGSTILAKPFDRDRLVDTVRTALGTGQRV
ncbi:response regulator [Actinoplanes sp. NEAU-A12]|uniref:histidine kinase n=1 Tax=Actinoplanes sandaracinus TaxID=3045177 RepID=A0ABT6WS59_9ACTN|nr:response regulator [Actinoplanes sandaracinus]MDI6102582.1 response regulator [Actinoplanes sandaracinus]